jgi:uncharacterized SAM-binding protein YcdF (DUF218 family)
MDIFISKLLPLFVLPLGMAIWVGLAAGYLLSTGRRRAGWTLLMLDLGGLWAASTFITAAWLVGSLERRYLPVPVANSPAADAIVVLGGSIGAAVYPRQEPDLSDAADRVLHAARLYRAGKASWVVVSGGNLPWRRQEVLEAELAAGLLHEWGVPRSALLIEGGSANTRQNALNTRQLLEQHGLHRVLLVTSAMHMPRALAAFRSAGVDAVPSPTDYTVVDESPHTPLDFLPNSEDLARTTRAIKEYLGLGVYRWRGWIGEPRNTVGEAPARASTAFLWDLAARAQQAPPELLP